ncbi:heterogeneous nuclear ribonucleoprotein A/B-like isoform X2 [Sycon ciliatum]|uniref:heterogeneous nuclear ribonucleoprotein A/B-like isoform X2 n=1 Tax=Sycon ciliatum TaxID=27933 RepID=UPI0020ACD6AB
MEKFKDTKMDLGTTTPEYSPSTSAAPAADTTPVAPESSPATMSTSNSAANEAPASVEPSGQPVDQDASTDAAQSEEAVDQADSKANPSDSNESETRDPPNEPGKMFIGGLSWQTDQGALNTYFSKYGEVKESVVMTDTVTGRSRGFGFVTFKDPSSVDRVQEEKRHMLDQKQIDPKVAIPRKQVVNKTKKLFLGGLAQSTTETELNTYFEERWSKPDECVIMVDKQSHRPRGFGFAVFKDESTVDEICKLHYLEINGRMVEAKKAQPKELLKEATRHRPTKPYGGFNTAYPQMMLDAYTMQAIRGGSGGRKGPQRALVPFAPLGYYHAAAAAAAIDPRMRLATMAPFYDPYTMSMMRQPMGMTSGQDRNAGYYQSGYGNGGGSATSSSRFQQPLSPTGPAQAATTNDMMSNVSTSTMSHGGMHSGFSSNKAGYGGVSSQASAASMASSMAQMTLNGPSHGQGASAGGAGTGYEQHAPSTSFGSSTYMPSAAGHHTFTGHP